MTCFFFKRRRTSIQKTKKPSIPQERSPRIIRDDHPELNIFEKKIENEHRQENVEENKKLLNHERVATFFDHDRFSTFQKSTQRGTRQTKIPAQ